MEVVPIIPKPASRGPLFGGKAVVVFNRGSIPRQTKSTICDRRVGEEPSDARRSPSD
jgi:hypothetical protein